MKTSKSFLFPVCLSLLVSFGSCTCKPLSNNVQGDFREAFYSQLSEQDLMEEEDTEARMENLLGTMKETFLRKLNLSDVPEEHSKISPPQFMMELYNKYASDSSIPQSDVIRSFTAQDISLSWTNGTKTKHRLQFNISIPSHERITTAELQLFFTPEPRPGVSSNTFKATVKVYEVDYTNLTSTTQLLVGKEVSGSASTWETFDVTTAIQSWIKLGHGATVFDVMVDRKNCDAPQSPEEEQVGCLNMSMSVGENTSAALIVFSDDLGSRRSEKKKELREMILHEEETILHSGVDWNREDQFLNEIFETQHQSRRKRRAERQYCQRTSLKVNFRDIGWDSWIVAPPEYDAYECRGLCYHPLTDEMTPSKHALIQTLLNIRDPRKANMACCVPIKLDPITVMYNDNGRLTIRYLYEEMKVAECGCR